VMRSPTNVQGLNYVYRHLSGLDHLAVCDILNGSQMTLQGLSLVQLLWGERTPKSCLTKSVNDSANPESVFFLCTPPLAPALANTEVFGGRLILEWTLCTCVTKFLCFSLSLSTVSLTFFSLALDTFSLRMIIS